MAEQNDSKKRQQLSKVVDLDISHARVRKYVSDHGINRESKEKVQQFKSGVEVIKKAGAPALGPKPKKPVKPKKDDYKDDANYDAAITAYNAEIEKYTATKKKYDADAETY